MPARRWRSRIRGLVAGRVTDPSGAVVSGAVVTATAANGATAKTRTNTDGHYLLAPLEALTRSILSI